MPPAVACIPRGRRCAGPALPALSSIGAKMSHPHRYQATLHWTGAAQDPTSGHADYSRNYEARVPGKPRLTGSADDSFRGDASLHNPEDLLLIALAACHMLSHLAECARGGVRVVAHEDEAHGTMALQGGRMRFTDVLLRPKVTIDGASHPDAALRLHE